MRARLFAPVWLFLCLALGGSSGGGVFVNGLLQIFAGAILFYLACSRQRLNLDGPARVVVIIVLAAVALALVSLIPLPPTIWRHLGGRADIAQAYTLMGMSHPWLPLSLVPDATIAMVFSVLPPLAMFLLVLGSSVEGRQGAIIVLVVFTFASVLFGTAQQVTGYDSSLYIYQYTSRGGAVGFFANRNHLATLCLMSMPFLAALIAIILRKRGRAPGAWMPAAGALVLLTVGVLVVQSTAGWLLLVPNLIACGLLLLQRHRRGGVRARALLAAIVVALVLALSLAVFAPWSTTDIFPVAEANPQTRRAIMAVTWNAARDFFPFGSGPGSFLSVYPRFEDSTAGFTAYVNHAHNDYLELLLEQGLVGILVLGAFFVWWIGRIRHVWRPGGDVFARAATIGIGVVLAHSIVDYPLRTAAIACVVALCGGMASAASFSGPTGTPARAPSSRTIQLGRSTARTTGRLQPMSSVT